MFFLKKLLRASYKAHIICFHLPCALLPLAHGKLNGLPTAIFGCTVCRVPDIKHTTNKGFRHVLEVAHGILGTVAVCSSFVVRFLAGHTANFYFAVCPIVAVCFSGSSRQNLCLPCARDFGHGKI